MDINLNNIPTFDINMDLALKYRKTSNNDYRNFIDVYIWC